MLRWCCAGSPLERQRRSELLHGARGGGELRQPQVTSPPRSSLHINNERLGWVWTVSQGAQLTAGWTLGGCVHPPLLHPAEKRNPTTSTLSHWLQPRKQRVVCAATRGARGGYGVACGSLSPTAAAAEDQRREALVLRYSLPSFQPGTLPLPGLGWTIDVSKRASHCAH